ncbi:PqiB family protein [Gallaecimonas mangrovi]|uniref:PqiB family protein n=1 Tax=Gallaecimonas mangrovi TaxID=2291597 RepID=UPI000E20557A|nr:MlaD family protein [Gallaecimonas mangrovi]
MDNNNGPDKPQIVHRKWSLSLVWLVPLVALAVAVTLLVKGWLSQGPTITIQFDTAAGLEPGKTPVKYMDIQVGTLEDVTLSPDHDHIEAKVNLNNSAEFLTKKDTLFWVVRPRIGAGGVSGIDTVLSGAYIAADEGKSSQYVKQFTGLETPPSVVSRVPGTSYVLHSKDLGSLDVNSPIYYRRIQVGHVASYQLDKNGKGVTLHIFIKAPFDKFVSKNSHFWNASGVDLSLNAEGFTLNTQSVATLLAGGIAFSTSSDDQTQAKSDSHFVLAKDKQTALARQDGPSVPVKMRFSQSLRGLEVDAPVEFLGLNIGHVESVDLDYNADSKNFSTLVGIRIYPERLGNVAKKLPQADGDEAQGLSFIKTMVQHGLRAQAKTGNLLTGKLYVAIDFMPNAKPASVSVDNNGELVLPTVGGQFDKLQEQLGNIVNKVNKIPFDQIGNNLNHTLADLDTTLKGINGQLLPKVNQNLDSLHTTLGNANQMLGPDAALQQNLGQTLLELQRAARSVRALVDQLSRHPESLLLGRPDDDNKETKQ